MIKTILKEKFRRVIKNSYQFSPKLFSEEKQCTSKPRKNFFLHRITSVQQNLRTESTLETKATFHIQDSPLMKAQIDYNLKKLSINFNEIQMVMTIYMMGQQFKLLKNEEINKKYELFMKILEKNLLQIKKPKSFYTLFLNFQRLALDISKDLELKFFNRALEIFQTNSFFSDEGNEFLAFVELYLKVENQINFEKTYIMNLFNIFYENWQTFNVTNCIKLLTYFISSKFASDILINLVESLSIFKTHFPYLTFVDYNFFLIYSRKLIIMIKVSKLDNIEEIKNTIETYSKQILFKLFEKATQSNIDTKINFLVRVPKKYYFVNKSILIKIFMLIKDLEVGLQNENLSKEYINLISQRKIIFQSELEQKELIRYYRCYCLSLSYKDDILHIISSLTK